MFSLPTLRLAGFALAFAFAIAAQAQTVVRVLHYNIHRDVGGTDSNVSSQPALAKVVNHLAPDVWAINELGGNIVAFNATTATSNSNAQKRQAEADTDVVNLQNGLAAHVRDAAVMAGDWNETEEAGETDNWKTGAIGGTLPNGSAFGLAAPIVSRLPAMLSGSGSVNPALRSVVTGCRDEFGAGTNPRDAASAFRIVSITRSVADVQIAWPTISGKRYQVQWRESLSAGTWSALQNNIAGTGGVLVATDSAAAQRFYRVVTLP